MGANNNNNSDYRGNVMVLLFNFGAFDFRVKKGDRIAQLILEKICTADPVEHSSLDVTKRGSGGLWLLGPLV